jgi:hypothetical protein
MSATEPLTTQQALDLSYWAYSQAGTAYVDGPIALPAGFSYLTSDGAPVISYDPGTGFYGAALVSSVGQVVIAFEGTNLDTGNDTFTTAQAVDDTDITYGGSAPSYASAYALTETAIQAAEAAGYSTADISLTGHSLGGADAEYVGQQTGLPGITFGAPGIPTDDTPYSGSNFIDYVDRGDPVGSYAPDGDEDAVLKAQNIAHYGQATYIGSYENATLLFAASAAYIAAENSSSPTYAAAEYAASASSLSLAADYYHPLGNYAYDLNLTVPGASGALAAIQFSIEQGETTDIGTVTPLAPGETLTLDQTSGEGRLSLQLIDGVETVVYTAPATFSDSQTDTVSYTVTDQNNTIVSQGTTTVSLDGGPILQTPLAYFDNSNGQGLYGDVIFEENGNLYGTASLGGTSNGGTVYEIVNSGGTYAVSPTVLANLTSAISGDYPATGLIADSSGDLFGVTESGGPGGDGTVFEIVNTSTGFAATPTVLASFSSDTGGNPQGGLTMDSHGDLFGTTYLGGAGGAGTVFEILNTSTGYAATPTVLANFDNSTLGGFPVGGSLLIDPTTGDLFGTTTQGGSGGAGTVFEIVNTATGYASTPILLASFDGGALGGDPETGLTMDANGDLFGTTLTGGSSNDGVIFEIVNTSTGYASAPIVLVSFNGTDGANPYGNLNVDANGDLFGTTSTGGPNGFSGTAFELVYNNGTYASTPITLVGFNVTNGDGPLGGLTTDASDNQFGSTYNGGYYGDGVVYGVTTTDSSAVVAGEPATSLSQSETAVIATVQPGLPGDTLTVTQTGGLGSVSLQLINGVEEIIYTAPSSIPVSTVTDVTYTVTDQNDSDNVYGGELVNLDAPCFADGTCLDTQDGHVAVEALRVGDLVLTASGAARPVSWIGWRRLDLRRHPDPAMVWPVRILKDALAHGVPRRDLVLSPDHAVMLQGRLIPARLLINGSTIRQDVACRSVTYFHIELETHDILLAEGAPAESYLDTGNRDMFENAGLPRKLHPEIGNDQARRQALSCMPFDTAPDVVEPVWRAIAARAEAIGWPMREAPALVEAPDLAINAGGRMIRPVLVDGDRYVFAVPACEAPLRLVSTSARPNGVWPWHDDRRQLGVQMRRLILRQGHQTIEIAMDDPALVDGWWQTEWDGRLPLRWTNGDAILGLMRQAGLVEVELAAVMPYPPACVSAPDHRRRAASA